MKEKRTKFKQFKMDKSGGLVYKLTACLEIS